MGRSKQAFAVTLASRRGLFSSTNKGTLRMHGFEKNLTQTSFETRSAWLLATALPVLAG